MNSPSPPAAPLPSILIIDDTPANLGVAMEYLGDHGFEVGVARSGEAGLKRVATAPTDLILLDVMMPGIDGFETCRRLKANPATADIPVIFMTALSDAEDTIRGFEAGGVDYVTKPIHVAEMMARITTHLGLRAAQQRLNQQNERLQSEIAVRERAEAALQQAHNALEERVTQRTRELSELNAQLKNEIQVRMESDLALAKRTQSLQESLKNLSSAEAQLVLSEKMATLGQLVAGVAHEINTPIGAIKSSGRSIADILGESLANLAKLYQTVDAESLTLFTRLIARANEPTPLLSSREARVATRETTAALEAENIEDAQHKARILVQLHAQGALADYLPLLRHEKAELILETAQCLETIIGGTNNINTAVDRVAHIVLALKSFSRVDVTEERIAANLSHGMETVLTIYHSQIKQGTELVREYEAIPPLHCLPDELNQVWTNLIHNALQAMNHKGTLTIGIRRIGNDAVVSVGDSGCGIPEAIRGKIFDVFFTTKPTGVGSGLGLDIVKKIVDKHHGRIDVQSEVGVGTTFSVYLPYTAPYTVPAQ